VIERAYQATASPASVQYVELHATATPAGDATELAALNAVYSSSPRTRPVIVGAVKAHIGHTLEAAGLAGLIKVVLALQHRTIPPLVIDGARTPRFAWDHSSLDVAPAPVAWDPPRDGRPRRAAVSAFGVGGFNAHVVVEEPCRRAARRDRVVARGTPGQRIVIAGAGVLTPDFRSADEPAGSTIPCAPNGSREHFEIDWRRLRIAPRELEYGNPSGYAVLEAVDQALRRRRPSVRAERIGVVVVCRAGGRFWSQWQVGLSIGRSGRRARTRTGIQRDSPDARRGRNRPVSPRRRAATSGTRR
jgi:hypothetical protein